jgi:hypothetical protein
MRRLMIDQQSTPTFGRPLNQSPNLAYVMYRLISEFPGIKLFNGTGHQHHIPIHIVDPTWVNVEEEEYVTLEIDSLQLWLISQKAGGGSRESKAWSEINMATATNKAFLDYYKVRSGESCSTEKGRSQLRLKVYWQRANGTTSSHH